MSVCNGLVDEQADRPTGGSIEQNSVFHLQLLESVLGPVKNHVLGGKVQAKQAILNV